MKIATLILTVATVFYGFSQSVHYDDVAVIVNDNSSTSIEIGDYFQNTRNIPDENIIHIVAPVVELIDSVQFEQVRSQIETYMLSQGMDSTINYIVTTKGVPLKINNYTENLPFDYSSFDSELTLFLGDYSNEIYQPSAFSNPVYGDSVNFSRENSGIYLVTRLDGYTKQDVFDLIDRSGPEIGVNQLSANIILDIQNTVNPGDSTYFANQLTPTDILLQNEAWNSVLDLELTPVISQNNVFGYIGMGHGPFIENQNNYQWVNGGVASFSICNSAYTFDINNSQNHYLIANLIADGATGALGTVDYIFFSQIHNSTILWDRYLNTENTFNLAESYYYGEKTLSWQTVIIGDPKTSIRIDNTVSLEESKIDFKLFPNPSAGELNIQSSESIQSISVFDLNGRKVEELSEIKKKNPSLNLNHLNAGSYFITIQTESQTISEKLMITK